MRPSFRSAWPTDRGWEGSFLSAMLISWWDNRFCSTRTSSSRFRFMALILRPLHYWFSSTVYGNSVNGAGRLKDWQVHDDDDDGHDYSHNQEKNGLDPGSHLAQPLVQFSFMKFGDISEHRLHGACLLTDCDHLERHLRKYFAPFQSSREQHPFLNLSDGGGQAGGQRLIDHR